MSLALHREMPCKSCKSNDTPLMHFCLHLQQKIRLLMSAEHLDLQGGYKNSQDLLHSCSAKCVTLIAKTELTVRKKKK